MGEGNLLAIKTKEKKGGGSGRGSVGAAAEKSERENICKES